jgi:hypothetical protein
MQREIRSKIAAAFDLESAGSPQNSSVPQTSPGEFEETQQAAIASCADDPRAGIDAADTGLRR